MADPTGGYQVPIPNRTQPLTDAQQFRRDFPQGISGVDPDKITNYNKDQFAELVKSIPEPYAGYDALSPQAVFQGEKAQGGFGEFGGKAFGGLAFTGDIL